MVLEIKNPPEEGWESASAAEQRSATSPARSRTTTRRGGVHSHYLLSYLPLAARASPFVQNRTGVALNIVSAERMNGVRVSQIQTAIFAVGLALSPAAAQNSRPTIIPNLGPVSVRLEAHEGRTTFKIGDPIILDLVFTTNARGYAVDTNTTPYLPPVDIVSITPDTGWTRSHAVATMHGLNGNTLVGLGRGAVRVPILLNRSITFLQPGILSCSLANMKCLLAQNACSRRMTTRRLIATRTQW